MIHNKLCDLLSVLVLAAVTPHRIYERDIYPITVRCIKERTRLAIVHKKNFFKIAKCMEPIAIGETLRRIEGRGNSQFLKTVVSGMSEDRIFEYEGSRYQDIMREASIPITHELACLSKLMGHPFCDIEATAADLHQKVHEERPVNLGMVLESVNQAKQDFIGKYI